MRANQLVPRAIPQDRSRTFFGTPFSLFVLFPDDDYDPRMMDYLFINRIMSVSDRRKEFCNGTPKEKNWDNKLLLLLSNESSLFRSYQINMNE